MPALVGLMGRRVTVMMGNPEPFNLLAILAGTLRAGEDLSDGKAGADEALHLDMEESEASLILMRVNFERASFRPEPENKQTLEIDFNHLRVLIETDGMAE